MEKRILGKTGLEVSCLGFGGFHLLEVPNFKAVKLLNEYLDRGGNYIETAISYGGGESERKIANVLKTRRDECILVSKSADRDAAGFRKSVTQSLSNLGIKNLDIILFHGVGTMDDLDKILSDDGAYSEALKMKDEGLVKHIGLSMHGQPDVLIEALNRADFEVVMTTLNYYDVNNFPKLLGELVPLANKKNVGIILMKPLADGLLYKNIEDAFNYALSLNVSVVVTGINNMDMLKADMKIAENFVKLTDKQMDEIIDNASELCDYVCRQCSKCDGICPQQIDFMELFRLEGLFDRQMRNGVITDTGDFALRDRLRFWFSGHDKAKLLYEDIEFKGSLCDECGACSSVCPYNIDIQYKTKLADYKLGETDIY